MKNHGRQETDLRGDDNGTPHHQAELTSATKDAYEFLYVQATSGNNNVLLKLPTSMRSV